MTMDRRGRPALWLDTDALRSVASVHGLSADRDIARALGVSPATVSRLRHGGDVSGRFVAAALDVFNRSTFYDLFQVIHDPS
jgi:transcriptional regulator with XRE-family HTH domain